MSPDPWRRRCPDGHTSLTVHVTTNTYRCRSCEQTYTGTPVDPKADDSDTIETCPECDAADIYRRRPSIQGREHVHAYRCQVCGERFDDPTTRTPENQDCLPGGTLASRLDKASPDEVARAD